MTIMATERLTSCNVSCRYDKYGVCFACITSEKAPTADLEGTQQKTTEHGKEEEETTFGCASQLPTRERSW